MQEATIAAIGAVIGILAALSGVVLGWTGHARGRKKEVKNEGEAAGALHTDVDYIKRGIDDIRADMRKYWDKSYDHEDRLARVEESAKSAHKRIDRIDEYVGKEK